MDLVEVYKVRAEAPEAVLAPLYDVFTREADVVRAFSHREANLRGQDDVVANAFERAAGDLFGETTGIDVCRVYKVAPGIEKRSHDLSGGPFIGLLPEGHAPQTQLRDHQPRAPKTPVLHTLLPDLHRRKTILYSGFRRLAKNKKLTADLLTADGALATCPTSSVGWVGPRSGGSKMQGSDAGRLRDSRVPRIHPAAALIFWAAGALVFAYLPQGSESKSLIATVFSLSAAAFAAAVLLRAA